jgi:hypothetical protein
MDDANNDANELTNESSFYADKARGIFLEKQKVTNFKYPLTATSIVIPALPGRQGRHMILTDINHPDKRLLYMAIIAAYNYAFTDDSAPLSNKNLFSGHAYFFVTWLNKAEISNRYNILKEYESHRFDKLDNHGGSSALIKLRAILNYALDRTRELSSAIEPEQLQYLFDLNATKISPNLNKKQGSLASYFGALDWLRDDDVGIGNQLYLVLASPKLTMNSLKLTVSVIITELYKYKSALRAFLIEGNFTDTDFYSSDFKDKPQYERAAFIGKIFYSLLCKYHENKNEHLRSALELVLLSNVTSKANFLKMLPAFESKDAMEVLFLSKTINKGEFSNHLAHQVFNAKSNGHLFSLDVLQKLCDTESALPITELETLMFSWLMASLTVQPSDISKLTRYSFRFFKVGNRTAHIECEYFKGRANAIHNTRSLSTRKLEGKALYLYLKQSSAEQIETFKSANPVISNGLNSITGVLMEVLSLDVMHKRLMLIHKQQDSTPVAFLASLKTLIQHGKHTGNIITPTTKYTCEELKELVAASATASQKNLFGLRAIKNSAVHAYSDPYTLHYLINRNSHTNQTEKLNYCNEGSEEWMNACGRITRSVMIDFINNVFDLDFEGDNDVESNKARAKFNSEFINVADSISYKSAEMVSRLKVLTEQPKGKINEVGVLALSDNGESNEFAPIFVLDSPVTVFKILNYQYEFENNYKKLLSLNPEFLFKTVMPTIEWMEHVLDKLSKSALEQGKAMFNQMQDNGVSISVFHSI